MTDKLYIIFCVVLLATACNQPDQSRQTVTIGATLPLSGDVSFLGEGVRNSMELALDDLSNTTHKYQVQYQDDKFQGKTATSNVRKFTSTDDVDALVSVGSDMGNVVSPLAQTNEVVHVNVGASDATVANGSYNFVHWTRPADEAEVWAEEAAERGYDSVAIFTENDQGNLAQYRAVKEHLNITIVYDEKFDSGTQDFRTMILKAQEQNPDAYLILALSPAVEALYKQLQEAGVDKDISSIESFELSSQTELFEGEWYVTAAGATPKYKQRYVERYGKEPSIASPNAYDAVMMIAKAYEELDDPSDAELLAYLTNFSYDGAVGPITVDDDGIIHSVPTVKRVQNGTSVPVNDA